MSTIAIGDRGISVTTVSEADTAIQLGSGDVPVLATPRAIAWLEAAAIAALGDLAPGMTSVGINISVDHTSPTLVGAEIRAVAEVRAVEGPRVEFDVRAFEGESIIAGGTHTRVIVDRQRFLMRAQG